MQKPLEFVIALLKDRELFVKIFWDSRVFLHAGRYHSVRPGETTAPRVPIILYAKMVSN